MEEQMTPLESLMAQLTENSVDTRDSAAEKIGLLIEKGVRVATQRPHADCDEMLPVSLRDVVVNHESTKVLVCAVRDQYLAGHGSVTHFWALGKAYTPEAADAVVDIILAQHEKLSIDERMQALYSLSNLVSVKRCRVPKISTIKDWLAQQAQDKRLSQPEIAALIIARCFVAQ